MTTLEVREDLRLAIDREAWPDGTPMVRIRLQIRNPEGRWLEGRGVAFPARLAGDVARALAASPRRRTRR